MAGRARIDELVAEARKAQELRERLAGEGRDPSEVDEVLEGLYRDIGRAMVAAPGAVPDPGSISQEGFTDELPDDEDDDGWYTDEGEVPVTGGPLFEPGELSDDTEVPEASHHLLGRPGVRDDESDAGAVYVVETTDSMAERTRDDLSCGLAQLAHGVHAAWKPELHELLDLLALPSSFDDPQELSVEASRVQWASSEVAYRLADFPDDLRVCLIGLLAARAQLLRTRLDVDVGLRMSLDHLQRYRIDHELPLVRALLPNPAPELGSWQADVRAWWALLHPVRP